MENAMPRKRKLTTEDLYKFQLIADAQISPDGQSVLFTNTRFHPDRKKNTYISHIWRVFSSGGTPTQFTGSSESESNPRWCPDGSEILFLSARDAEEKRKGKTQLWLIPSTGGEARKISNEKHGVSSPRWSPDGRSILFLTRVPVEPGRDKLPREKETDVVHIRRISYRMNGGDYHHEFRTHLHIIPARGGKSRQITKGDWSVESFTWSADGTRIYFTGNITEDTDYTYRRNLYSIPTSGGRARTLCGLPGHLSSPESSPDGKKVAFVGNDRKRGNGTSNYLYTVSSGGGKPRCVTNHLDVSVGQSVGSDSRAASPSFGPVWSPDGKSISFLTSIEGSDRLLSLSLDTGETTKFASENTTIESYSCDARQTSAAFTRMSPTELAEVWVTGPGKPPRPITAFNRLLLGRLDLATPERFIFKASDRTEVEGWIMFPPGSRRKTHPSILQIHGGPQTAYGYGFMHEFHLLNAAGFAVYYTNPRGSSSYGEDWSCAVELHYGERDYKDIMETVKHVLKSYPIDPGKMGVTGGSYGGFMTNWIVGHTKRFKAACTQRSISNWVSFFGTSDIGWGFSQAEIGDLPWKNLEEYWKRSPLAYVDKIETPLLIIHSEEDWRCPIEQAQQLFTALKWRGKETELMRFPGESHELSRSGKPGHRVERLEAISGWFGEKLLGRKRR